MHKVSDQHHDQHATTLPPANPHPAHGDVRPGPGPLTERTKLLSDATRADIDAWVQRFPPDRSRSAVLAALRAAQHQNHGWLSTELMDAVAEYLRLPPIQVYEVASFYSMFETKPCGRVHVSVCTNISCWLRGAERIVEAVEKHLGVKTGESTPDGRFYLKREEECLAACNNAPMMMVDHVYHEHLTPESACRVLDEVK
ncbi:MAG: NADH-quinone oxidoreductase subunit NuoE [Pseudomonadota bacterium]|jgi:NADH-quinone oxidoreductase subunit E